MTAIRVGVIGAAGRMGSEACRAIEDANDLDLVARVDEDDDLAELAKAGAQVAVDFTHPGVVMDNLRYCVDASIHAVVGTSGFTPDRLEQLRTWLAQSPATGVLIAPNFGIGAV